jgi:hypothetical protein
VEHLVSTRIILEFLTFLQGFLLIVPQLEWFLFQAAHVFIIGVPLFIGLIGVFVVSLHDVFLFKFIFLRIFKLKLFILLDCGFG